MSTPRALKPLRNPAYRWLASALVASMVGAGIWMVALVWQIVAIGGGAAELSLVAGGSAGGGRVRRRRDGRAVLPGLLGAAPQRAARRPAARCERLRGNGPADPDAGGRAGARPRAPPHHLAPGGAPRGGGLR